MLVFSKVFILLHFYEKTFSNPLVESKKVSTFAPALKDYPTGSTIG
jgi:hypothetical protein